MAGVSLQVGLFGNRREDRALQVRLLSVLYNQRLESLPCSVYTVLVSYLDALLHILRKVGARYRGIVAPHYL